jgi:hypothetical protein
MRFLKACFFEMVPGNLLFRAYLSIMQSLYNYEDLLFWEVQWNISGPISELEGHKINFGKLGDVID